MGWVPCSWMRTGVKVPRRGANPAGATVRRSRRRRPCRRRQGSQAPMPVLPGQGCGFAGAGGVVEGSEPVLGDAGGAAPGRGGVVGEDLHHLVAGGEPGEADVPAGGVPGDVVPDADGEHDGHRPLRPVPGRLVAWLPRGVRITRVSAPVSTQAGRCAAPVACALYSRQVPSLWPAFEHCPLSSPCSSHQVADGRFPGLLARENSEGAAARPTVTVD
jgi:hypothetical protein